MNFLRKFRGSLSMSFLQRLKGELLGLYALVRVSFRVIAGKGRFRFLMGVVGGGVYVLVLGKVRASGLTRLLYHLSYGFGILR